MRGVRDDDDGIIIIAAAAGVDAVAPRIPEFGKG
jgi:hypothetical protein